MPKFAKAPRGSTILVASLIGLAASGPALADSSEVLVRQSLDQNAIVISIADLDLASAYDRDTLQIRINRAARQVCDIADGSLNDDTPKARACFEQARQGAVSQLAARGVPMNVLAGG